MEEENRWLKRMYADLSMQNDFLKEALGKSDRAIRCPVGKYAHLPWVNAESEVIADLLTGLTDAHKTWRLGLCFLHLRNVKG